MSRLHLLFLLSMFVVACANSPVEYSHRVDTSQSVYIYECIRAAQTDFDKIGCGL